MKSLFLALVAIGLSSTAAASVSMLPDYRSDRNMVALRFGAKEMCSCRFVMKQDAAYCLGYIDLGTPSPVQYDVDESTHQVTAYVPKGPSLTVTYQGSRYGCVLP